MKQLYLLLVLIIYSSAEFAQAVPSAEITSLIPKGYRLLSQYEGDLNLDSLKDLILVVGADRSMGDSALHTLLSSGTNLKMRPVLILLGQKDHSYKRVSRNDQAVAQALGNIDPFNTIRCGPGFFIIEHALNEGNQHCIVAARFEWAKKQSEWYLRNYSHSCLFINSPDPAADAAYQEKTPKNFGKIPFGKYRYPMSIEIDEWGQ